MVPDKAGHAVLTRDELDVLLIEATAAPWRRAFRAALHPGLVMLASSAEEEPYLIRLTGEQIEALGPLPRAVCVGEKDKALPCFSLERRDWLPASAALIHGLNPFGVWYVPQDTATVTRYVQHTQGYHDALAAFLGSPGATAFMDQPWQVGRVRCLLLFPNGSYATAPDAGAQPVILPLGHYSRAETLRRDLDDQIMERTWPGSL